MTLENLIQVLPADQDFAVYSPPDAVTGTVPVFEGRRRDLSDSFLDSYSQKEVRKVETILQNEDDLYLDPDNVSTMLVIFITRGVRDE
jgi:hypothetical protein